MCASVDLIVLTSIWLYTNMLIISRLIARPATVHPVLLLFWLDRHISTHELRESTCLQNVTYKRGKIQISH